MGGRLQPEGEGEVASKISWLNFKLASCEASWSSWRLYGFMLMDGLCGLVLVLFAGADLVVLRVCIMNDDYSS